MPITKHQNGISSMGIPLLGRAFGKTYFVDVNGSGSDGYKGTDSEKPFATLTKAFEVVSDYDTIMLGAGNFTGNYETPVNAAASFVSVIGFPIGAYGMATWMGATTSSSPIIDVRARGWSFENIEFNCPTGAAALRLTKSTNGTTHRCDFTTIRNNIFTTGKYGIEVNGGGTHVHVQYNKFDQLTTSGAFGIIVLSTTNQIPAFWVVEDNIFATSVNHIGPANATYGWSESTFRRNIHQRDGVSQDVTMMLDIRASGGGGNMVINNSFDMTASEWTTGLSNAAIRANSTDFAAGNECNDGPAETVLNDT